MSAAQTVLPLGAGSGDLGPTRDQVIAMVGGCIEGHAYLYAHARDAAAGRAGVRWAHAPPHPVATVYCRLTGNGKRAAYRKFATAERWVLDTRGSAWCLVPLLISTRGRASVDSKGRARRRKGQLHLPDLAAVVYLCAWPWCDAFLGTEWGRLVVLGDPCPVALDEAMAAGCGLALRVAEYWRLRTAPGIEAEEREAMLLRAAWHVWEEAGPLRGAALTVESLGRDLLRVSEGYDLPAALDLRVPSSERLGPTSRWSFVWRIGPAEFDDPTPRGWSPRTPSAERMLDALDAFESAGRLARGGS